MGNLKKIIGKQYSGCLGMPPPPEMTYYAGYFKSFVSPIRFQQKIGKQEYFIL